MFYFNKADNYISQFAGNSRKLKRKVGPAKVKKNLNICKKFQVTHAIKNEK